MAVMVQYEMEGVVCQWLLDIVDVGQQHAGAQLATEFIKILDDFGIRDKVSNCQLIKWINLLIKNRYCP